MLTQSIEAFAASLEPIGHEIGTKTEARLPIPSWERPSRKLGPSSSPAPVESMTPAPKIVD
jgi:hypothetical protein